MKRAILVGVLFVAASSVYAQREVRMNITISNPGDETAVVQFGRNVKAGHLRCDSHFKDGKIKKGAQMTTNCYASAENDRRNLEVTGVLYHEYEDCPGKRAPSSSFALKVYDGSHDFRCKGCFVHEDWSECSRDCVSNVLITIPGSVPGPCGNGIRR